MKLVKNIIFTSVFAALVTLVSATSMNAQAGGVHTKFMCGNVGGTEEWRIMVDLEKNLAGFFDNDTTVVIPLVDIISLESYPPQVQYTYEGMDTDGKSTIRIVYNATMKTAYVTTNVGEYEEFTYEAQDHCVADDLIDLE